MTYLKLDERIGHALRLEFEMKDKSLWWKRALPKISRFCILEYGMNGTIPSLPMLRVVYDDSIQTAEYAIPAYFESVSVHAK